MNARKISICLGLLFIFGIANFAMAQNNEIDKSTETRKMEKYKVKESTKQIDSQNIEVLDYGRIKIKKEKVSKTGEKTIEFHNNKGELIKELKLGGRDKPRMSQNKKLIGIQKYGFKNQELEFFDENGKKIKEFKKIKPYGVVYISDFGNFIAAGGKNTPHIPYKGGIAFYEQDGKLIKEIIYPEFWNGFGGFLNNNFTFLFKIPGKGVFLEYFSGSGDSLWNYSFGNMYGFNPFESFFIMNNQIYIRLLIDKQKYTWTFDKDGLVEKKKGW
jgi:hypothetical protein